MNHLEKAKVDPSAVFKYPREILQDQSLTTDEKRDILERWAYDEKAIVIAEEENMSPLFESRKSVLDEVLQALNELNSPANDSTPSPVKRR